MRTDILFINSTKPNGTSSATILHNADASTGLLATWPVIQRSAARSL